MLRIRLLSRKVRDGAVFVGIALILTALNRVVRIFGIPLFAQPMPIYLDDVKGLPEIKLAIPCYTPGLLILEVCQWN
jgi:hypothetical protein